MTKREILTAMINGTVITDEMKEFAVKELNALDNRKPSKAEVEKKIKNAELADDLLNAMALGTEYTVADLAKIPAFVGYSGSKITYLVNSLVKNGTVLARYEKRKTYYSKA